MRNSSLSMTYVTPFLLLLSLGSAVSAQDVQRSETQRSRTKLVMLGTGTPNPDPDRFGPATVVMVDDVPYLIDAGVGVVRRWTAAIRVNNLPATAIKTLFVTHLHSDHTLGYADLIFTPLILTPWWTNAPGVTAGGDRPLEAHGPEGLSAMTNNLIAAYADDIRIRGRSGPMVTTREISEGVVYQDERVTVNAFLVPHGAWPQAFGYRFKTPDKTIVISGDTGYSTTLAEQCNGCDMLVHEGGRVTIGQGSSHTSASELAKVAEAAKPKLLILYHQSAANDNAEGLRVIRSQYQGDVVVARDLQVFE
jgi:ribonuclease Z